MAQGKRRQREAFLTRKSLLESNPSYGSLDKSPHYARPSLSYAIRSQHRLQMDSTLQTTIEKPIY